MTGRFDFRQLKRTVSIADVLADKGISGQFRVRGDKLTGPCPLHGGDNPQAFVVNLSKNIWYCFTGCGTGGDVIEFVRKMDGKTYRQVAEYLSILAGSPPIRSAIRPSVKFAKPFRPFIRQLHLNPNAPLLRQKKIQPATARWFEAGFWSGDGFLKDCIGVRLHDIKGNPVGYAGRRLHQQDMKTYGKWKFPPGLPKSSLLYNYHRIEPAIKRGLVVVECPWGVMRLSQIGIPAVALLGTCLSPQQLDLLRMVPRIILMLDGDEAGKNAIRRISNNFDLHTRVQPFALPEDLDPDDLNDFELKKVSHFFLS
jgi:DNA primase